MTEWKVDKANKSISIEHKTAKKQAEEQTLEISIDSSVSYEDPYGRAEGVQDKQVRFK